MTLSAHISIPEAEIVEFCQRWRIKELAIFGSVLRDDFRPDSDVDVLVVFHEDAPRSLFDYFKAEEELEQIVGWKVDLVEKSAIRNPFRRHHILSHHEVIYAA